MKLKLSIRSKVIIIFISVFLFSSIFSGYYYTEHQKERKFEAIKHEISILADYKEMELSEIGKHNWEQFRLIYNYLNICDTNKSKKIVKKIEIVKQLSSDLISIKIQKECDGGEICLYIADSLHENKIYHKISEKINDTLKCKLEIITQININLTSTSKYIDYYLLKIDSVSDSIYFNKNFSHNLPFIGEKKEHKQSNKIVSNLDYYIYDSLLDFVFVIKTNTDLIKKDINMKIFRDLLFNYMIMFFLVLTMVYFTLKYVIKDVYKVKDALNEIMSGNLSHRIEHNRNDEIGELMNKFNAMSKSLEKEIINNENLEKMNINLQEEYDKYKALLDSTFESVFLSENGYIIDCNKAACEMFGYENMINLYVTDIVVKEDAKIIKINMLSEQDSSYKATGKRKDGSEFPILARGKTFNYRGKKLRASSAIDITIATKLEEANNVLNEEINKFKALIDVSDDAIILFSLDDRKVIQHNESLYTLFGWDKEDMKYDNPMDNLKDWVHPDYIEKLKDNFLKEEPYTVKLINSNGDIFDCLIKAKNISLGGKEYRISVLRNITDRTTIENYAIKLEKSNKELEQFAYIASHDLQEPIRTITSFLELFEERYYDIVDKDGKEFISYIMIAAHKQRKLINDLLRYSRLDTKREIRVHDLNQILELTLMNLNRLIDEKHAIISSKKLPNMNCDFTQISQLFENLIKNAIKFNNNAPHIIISFKDRVDDVLFIFEDNGIGIDKQYHKKIFQAFQRLSRDLSGTGIGLAIVNKVVENHNGKIWLESSEGNGSKFCFTISKKLKTS